MILKVWAREKPLGTCGEKAANKLNEMIDENSLNDRGSLRTRIAKRNQVSCVGPSVFNVYDLILL